MQQYCKVLKIYLYVSILLLNLLFFTDCFSSSGIDFLGDTVGLANKFAMCAESSAGVNQVFIIYISDDFLVTSDLV